MTITLTDAGKRYNRDWIFRHVDLSFHTGNSYAITGPNGSGKSTLLQAIAGSLNLSSGSIQFRMDIHPVPDENIFKFIAIAAPYLELIDEMTAREFLKFHSNFKAFIPEVDINQIIEIIGLEKAADKQIRYYSSGMRQRVKLAQAIFTDTPVLLLDEPCTNLDSTGYHLYHELIKHFCSNKLIIVSSNDEKEMDFCTQKISISNYK